MTKFSSKVQTQFLINAVEDKKEKKKKQRKKREKKRKRKKYSKNRGETAT